MFLEEWNDRNQRWESFDFWERNQYYNYSAKTEEEKEENLWEREFRVVEFDDDRWYYKFGVLSPGVRINPDEIDGPLADLRGFPKDACAETAERFKMEGCDAHSANWLTAEEFRDLAIKWRLLKGNDSPLAEMSSRLDDHIKRKLKWDHIIKEQDLSHIRMVYWFDN